MKGSSLDSLDLGCYDQLRSKSEKFGGNELELKKLHKLNKVTRLYSNNIPVPVGRPTGYCFLNK